MDITALSCGQTAFVPGVPSWAISFPTSANIAHLSPISEMPQCFPVFLTFRSNVTSPRTSCSHSDMILHKTPLAYTFCTGATAFYWRKLLSYTEYPQLWAWGILLCIHHKLRKPQHSIQKLEQAIYTMGHLTCWPGLQGCLQPTCTQHTRNAQKYFIMQSNGVVHLLTTRWRKLSMDFVVFYTFLILNAMLMLFWNSVRLELLRWTLCHAWWTLKSRCTTVLMCEVIWEGFPSVM